MQSLDFILEGILLSETYVNLLGSDKQQKEKYVDEVWEILKKSYSKIGGIKGRGFGSKQEMIEQIPFWKLVRKDGKIVAVVMYKDKKGRKMVAIGTDGSEEGQKATQDIYKNEFSRSFFELSDRALGAVLKAVGEKFALKYIKDIDTVKGLLKGNEVLEPDMNDSSVEFIKDNYPKIAKHFYQRKIGDGLKHKVLMGTSGKVITDN